MLVGDTGIEPVTSSVSRKRSPTELIARACLGQVERWRRDLNPCRRICSPLPRLSATPPRPGRRFSRSQAVSERTTGFEPATLTLAR